jgi:hypothetical protein
MSDEKKEVPKYYVHHAEQSAIGDYARVNNYIRPKRLRPTPAARS